MGVQVQRVEPDDLIRLERCQHCGRKILSGQVVMVKHGWSNSYTHQDFVMHVRCVRSVMLEAPAEQDQVAYEELRERILVSRQAFPEE